MKELNIRLKISYDKNVNAAYIYLKDIQKGEAVETITYDDYPDGTIGEVVIDLNKDKKVIGFEILSADKILPEELLAKLKA